MKLHDLGNRCMTQVEICRQLRVDLPGNVSCSYLVVVYYKNVFTEFLVVVGLFISSGRGGHGPLMSSDVYLPLGCHRSIYEEDCARPNP